MLTITIHGKDMFDEETQTFSTVDSLVLELEHSLVSLSKWESKWQIPFLSKNEKTDEQLFDYLYMMVLTPGVGREDLMKLTSEQIAEIQEYIQSPQSATTFNEYADKAPAGRGEIITAELVYFWMVTAGVPFECQHWHLNRLFSLLRIYNIKNSKQKPMSKGEIARRNRDLNAQRKAQLGTSG
jgi:hypothetical protein